MIYLNIQNKWEVCLFSSRDSLTLLKKALRKVDCPDIKETILSAKTINSGFTFTNFKLKASVVYISKASSKSQWFNTLVHELKHVQSHICDYYDVDESSEEAAYLIGYLMQKIIKWWN